MSVLEIKNLCARVPEKDILKGVDLVIKSGEVHAIMGPNGTGKSTLSSVIMGHPKYEVTGGEIILDGESLLEKKVDERARLGLFLAYQYPAEVSGVTNSDFVHAAMKANGYNESVYKFAMKYDRACKEWNKNPKLYVQVEVGGFDKDNQPKTVIKTNQWYQIKKDFSLIMTKYLDQLGISPLGRAKQGLQSTKSKKDKEMEELKALFDRTD